MNTFPSSFEYRKFFQNKISRFSVEVAEEHTRLEDGGEVQARSAEDGEKRVSSLLDFFQILKILSLFPNTEPNSEPSGAEHGAIWGQLHVINVAPC